MEDEPTTVITVTVDADGSVGVSLSPSEHPIDALRKAAAWLERYAAGMEREGEPTSCETCGTSPTGIRAAPDGRWQLVPCGHGVETGT